jgi:hypothetical protein
LSVVPVAQNRAPLPRDQVVGPVDPPQVLGVGVLSVASQQYLWAVQRRRERD